MSSVQRTVGAITALMRGTREQHHDYRSVDTGGQGDTEDFNDDIVNHQVNPVRRNARRGLAVALFILTILFIGSWIASGRTQKSCDFVDDGYQCENDISHFWGQYSPFFSVPSDISGEVPAKCHITFAQVLSRHGARDPTFGKSVAYGATVEYIHQNAISYNGHAKFLKNYTYTLGSDQLTDFGRQQMVNSGTKFYNRYRNIARQHIPFIRTSGQDRVIESAVNFTNGFHTAREGDKVRSSPDFSFPYSMVIIPEEDGFNNTLSHSACTLFSSSPGVAAQGIFAATFIPALTQRLSKLLPGVELTASQIIYLMDLCPFETVASPIGKPSPFCQLFTTADWKHYNYYQSLGKFYGFANGNHLGPTQGVGFANELVARLTNTPVSDHTSTNSTLDSSIDTFPLGRALYADFSHDNDMAGILAALGLFNSTSPLNKEKIQSEEETKGYSAAWTVPFAARIYFEKMRCKGSEEELVRVLVNDRVVPLERCEGDDLGRCKLGKFVDSLGFARMGGYWDKCFI